LGQKNRRTPSGLKIGKGFAASKATRSPTTSAAGVVVNAKGEVTVLAGTVEIARAATRSVASRRRAQSADGQSP